MQLVRWNRPRDLVNLQEEMDRLFRDFGRDLEGSNGEQRGWMPLADVRETTENFLLRLDLPGVEKENVKVSVFGETVHVRGERREESERKDGNWHRVERSHGTFERTFDLGTALDPEQVKAVYKNGVLEITVPKAESVRPREIDVEIAS